MTQRTCAMIGRPMILAVLVAVVISIVQPMLGQGWVAAGEPVASETPKEARGRLPNYFGQVVDEKQREAIYKIQADYAPKIAELTAQLEALIAQRDEKVEGVLTPEQRKRVEELRAAAKAKRDTSQDKPASEPAADPK